MNFSSLFQFLLCHKKLNECIKCAVSTRSLQITGLDTDSIAKFWDMTDSYHDIGGSAVL